MSRKHGNARNTHRQGSTATEVRPVVFSSISRRGFLGVSGAVAAGALIPAAAVSAGEPDWQDVGGSAGVGGQYFFWDTVGSMIFDDQLIRNYLPRCDGFTYRGVLTGIDPRYDYKRVIERLKEANPDIPVLLYSMANQFIYHGELTQFTQIDQHVLRGYHELGDLLMPEWDQPIGNSYTGDTRKSAYREWLVERISSWVDDMGTDGVFLDLYRFFPFRTLEPDAAAAYVEGTKQVMTEIVESLGSDKQVMFNGMFDFAPGNLESQLEGLPLADGALIEYFGNDPRRGQAPIEHFLPIPLQFPDKHLAFTGRTVWTYDYYQADYLWQRYTYAAYLLVANENTTFKYGATFRLPGGSDTYGRTGCEDLYQDWYLDIGEPHGEYEERDGLLVREFDNALAVVNPEPMAGDQGESHTLTLRRPMFDPEGQRYGRSVTVEPGTGLILLERPARRNRRTRLDLTDAAAAGNDWRWAERRRNHLHLDATPAGEEWEHDLLLDIVRTLRPDTELRALVRTDDPNARFEIEVEVDDAEAEEIRVVVVVGTEPAEIGTPSVPVEPMPYRMRRDAARRWLFRKEWQAFTADVGIDADGDWHMMKVDVRPVVEAGGRYVAHRLAHARLVGTMDIRWVEF